MTRRYAARVFWTAGIFNIVVGASGFLAPDLMAQSLGLDRPANPVFLHLTSWLVVVLGIGYCLTARAPERNQDLMLIGAIGKLFVLPMMFAAWRHGNVQFVGVVGSAADFVFALLFFDVLRRMSAFRVAPSPG
jgi:hypothetical protein